MTEDLPPEQAHLRGNTGAMSGSLAELDVNLRISRLVADQLREAGIIVDLLPATVPQGYRADAFVAIHADGGVRRGEHGWKIASPWRSSEASRVLRDEMAHTYALYTRLPQDAYGITYLMRGYYAFNWQRYSHAIAPSTPAVIIETGFVSSAADRAVIQGDPVSAARGISSGIILFLGEEDGMKPESFVPKAYPPMLVATDNAPLYFAAGDESRMAGRLTAGTVVRPFDEENGWVDLMVWGNFRVFGWMKESDLSAVSAM